MILLHGSWLAPSKDHPAAEFALWAERLPKRRVAGRASAGVGKPTDRPLRHPYALGEKDLDALVPGKRPTVTWASGSGRRTFDVLAWLPSQGDRPLPSRTSLDSGEKSSAPALALWRLPAFVFDATEAVRVVLTLAAQGDSPEVSLGDDLRFWAAAARFALALAHRQRFLPVVEQEGESYLARWRPLLDGEAEVRDFAHLAAAMPPACRALAWEPHPYGRTRAVEPPPRPEQAAGPGRLLHSFISAVVDQVGRSGRLGRKGARRSLGDAWWDALQSPYGVVETQDVAPEALRAFQEQYDDWLAAARGGGREVPAGETFRVCFRLEPPPATLDGGVGPAAAHPPLADGTASQGAITGAAPAGRDGRAREAPRWTLRYLLQAVDDPSLLVPAGEVWRQRGTMARFLDRRLEHPQERLLAGLGRAARLFPPVEASLDEPAPEHCPLTTEEAHRFIQDAALALRAHGFGVLVPGLDRRLRLRLHLGGDPADPARGTGKASFTWDSLVAFDWQVALGDQTLSREEFEHLARLKEPLVQVRGEWVELDPHEMSQALAFFEQHRADGALSLQEALQLALAPDAEHDQTGLPVERVETAGWLDDLLADIRAGQGQRTVDEPPDFQGTLRPYQKRGVAWLAGLRRYGLGACLADDMGLGKTIQLIALMLLTRQEARQEVGEPAPTKRRRGRKAAAAATAEVAGGAPSGPVGPVLLVCPTSVVGNWQHELARFSPALRVLVHHGAGRTREDLASEAQRYDVVVTTYALLPRDEAGLVAVDWEAVVLDEAQNVKNAATKAAQSARKLRARWRAALTGTPVENRLSELWSLFQFLNPGYLGSAEAFRKRFGNPIERANDAAAAARLKALVSPFILRRLKTDPAIIGDLPEKQEMKVFCTLTREQATLYEAVVRDSLREIEESEGIQRRGMVLATLTKLKQVCDHPALFLHDRSALDGRSGKLARLAEMLEEALSVDDRALIFTQYAEMGRHLQGFLEERFGEEVLFLHGGTPAKQRDQMVAAFQQAQQAPQGQQRAQGRRQGGPHLFILSIKAGGTGLNLTAANHVFHFDRWWNPAVENQATDRAFRIGQRRNVQVHKFICAGTFEESIDQLIEHKAALSESIVGAGESWLTEMSNAELRDLLALRQDVAVAA